MSPKEKYERLTDELRKAASHITNVPELREYLTRFPWPEAGQIMLEGLNLLSEPNVVHGKRNGKKIHEHVRLGYGPRLKGNEDFHSPPGSYDGAKGPVRDILLALQFYTEKVWSKKHELNYADKMRNKKNYGVENPQTIVYTFLNLLMDERRK